MLKTPVNRNPARPPGLEAQLLGAHGVAAELEDVEILPGENVPVAIQKRPAQMFRQSFERAAVLGVVGVNRIVGQLGANEIVVARVVQLRPLEARRRRVIDPQRFHPGVANIAGIAGAGHARNALWNWAAIARREKLPLLQREVRQLIEPNEEKLRALILVDIIFVAAIAEARGRTVVPGDDVLGFIVSAVERARHVAPEICQQRRFQLWIRAPQQQRIRTGLIVRLANRFKEQRFRLARTSGASEESVFCRTMMKLQLALKCVVVDAIIVRNTKVILAVLDADLRVVLSPHGALLLSGKSWRSGRQQTRPPH